LSASRHQNLRQGRGRFLNALLAGCYQSGPDLRPLLFLTVNGHEAEREIKASGPMELQIKCVASIAPLDTVEVIVNGEVAKTIPMTGREGHYTLAGTVKLEGSGARDRPSPMTVRLRRPARYTWCGMDGRPFVSAKDA
jgi:hypothetical protein